MPVCVGFVVDKVYLDCLFSEYFGFPCHYHSAEALYPSITGAVLHQQVTTLSSILTSLLTKSMDHSP